MFKNLRINYAEGEEFTLKFIELYESMWKPIDTYSDYFYTKNPALNVSFPEYDAFILDSVIRYFEPGKILEFGSGQSTRVMTEAVKDSGLATKIYCVDTYAPEEQKRCLRKMSVDFHESDIEMFDSSVILELKENDIFFIDSSHVLKNFEDVEYIYVHLFPIIPRGVIVHVHDIFLPFNYPANWLIEWKSVLTEQHILGTWLDNRKDIQIIAANNWNISQRLIPNSTEHNVGGSFWFKIL